jgi:RNA recognition motif. (a.k.a. RRM, RBD, or RNP domain)
MAHRCYFRMHTNHSASVQLSIVYDSCAYRSSLQAVWLMQVLLLLLLPLLLSLQDIREECKRYGAVTAVEIPRLGAPGMGYVYVNYAKQEHATTVSLANTLQQLSLQRLAYVCLCLC